MENEISGHIRLTNEEKELIPKALQGAETVPGFVHHAIDLLLKKRGVKQ